MPYPPYKNRSDCVAKKELTRLDQRLLKEPNIKYYHINGTVYLKCSKNRLPRSMRGLLSRAVLALLALSFAPVSLCLPPLQLYVELTPPGGVLKPPAGVYSGPVVINHPITIEGGGQVVIDGGGDDSVLTIRADKTVIRGLRLTNSGGSHDKMDAGILIEANNTLIENNKIDNSLFGVILQQANGNVVRGNDISSMQREISMRGDGIRLWYSNNNVIENNSLDHVRDLLFSNSSDNRIIGNHIQNSRMGMELIFSPGNEIENNTILNNVTGIVVVYSNKLLIRGNRIAHMRKLTGSGISFKESTGVVVSGNEIAHCAVGLLANSPISPENILEIRNNLFVYNDVAMFFYGEKGGHIVYGNHLENNFVDVLGSATKTVKDNDWRGNYWDKYKGFDSNNDGVGDQPYHVFLFSDRIWRDRPKAKFFRGSPALEMLDFAERLAPFSKPDMILTDPEPRM